MLTKNITNLKTTACLAFLECIVLNLVWITQRAIAHKGSTVQRVRQRSVQLIKNVNQDIFAQKEVAYNIHVLQGNINRTKGNKNVLHVQKAVTVILMKLD